MNFVGRAERALPARTHPSAVIPSDPVFLLILGVLALVFFFVYLMVRRTFLGFREGVERGKN